MPSPGDGSALPPKRRKKACQRCRSRKQRCDYQDPACRNCAAAGVECRLVVQDANEQNPAGYVQSLEEHAAVLERILNERYPGSAPDHLHITQSQTAALEQNTMYQDVRDPFQWDVPHTPVDMNFFDDSFGNGRLQSDSIGASDRSQHASPFAGIQTTSPNMQMPDVIMAHGSRSLKQQDQVSISTAASFFRTYFQFIHPQYPFLSCTDCSTWYMEWRAAPAHHPLKGWPAFFVKMIFAIGSLIQFKTDSAPQNQHHNLKAHAQEEQSIIDDSKSTPLIRMQAMLLSAMYALHSDSTSRIAHIAGTIIRFASIHGYHILDNRESQDIALKTRVWSCAYILDRAVSGSLDVPVSLPDMYISSQLHGDTLISQIPMPWLSDCLPSDLPQISQNNSTFAHVCKIRLLQSYIMHTKNSVAIDSQSTPEWEEWMCQEIDNWARSEEIGSHSLENTEGYQSPLWLQLISQLSRLILCRPTRENINTRVSDIALQASCDACKIFRAIQKSRQVAQPWLVVLTQFQAGVTLYYIMWARGIAIPRYVDSAGRDCATVLAIFADRWRNAEHYRDCLDLLARAVSSSPPLSGLEPDVRLELAGLARKVRDAGVHRHVAVMLEEICADNNEGEMNVEMR